MSSSLPPNPRDAKHRQPLRSWNHLPVTFVLMAISLLTSFYTKVGDDSAKADALFFRSQTQREEQRLMYNEILGKLQNYDNQLNPEGDEVYLKMMEDLDELDAALIKSSGSGDVLKDIKSGQIWRLFTPMFLHFGYAHIIFNMYWLWILGSLLEIRYRPLNYLLLVLGVALASNLTQALFSGTSFGGMSGVNYGLFGFIFLHMKYHPSPYFRLEKQTIFLMLVWLVICFTGAAGPVANWAHLFGLLTGAAVGFTNAMMSGGAQVIKRRSEFKRAISSAKVNALHQCHVCGITEKNDSNIEFRVLADGMEYCEKHLPPGHEL
jgi:GlpG protein